MTRKVGNLSGWIIVSLSASLFAGGGTNKIAQLPPSGRPATWAAPMKKPGLTLLWAVGGFGAATVVFGLSKFLWLSMAMMFLIGALDEISVILRATLVVTTYRNLYY